MVSVGQRLREGKALLDLKKVVKESGFSVEDFNNSIAQQNKNTKKNYE